MTAAKKARFELCACGHALNEHRYWLLDKDGGRTNKKSPNRHCYACDDCCQYVPASQSEKQKTNALNQLCWFVLELSGTAFICAAFAIELIVINWAIHLASVAFAVHP